ncbi:MAG: excinuclease ABC subunit UvrA, partial [Candidatus Uhrbacteria bacterium]|nr:excinuclease ABC subunit UvrA [Candidatus Uhrbacteria bacterium]
MSSKNSLQKISIKGARVNNLKNVSLDLPRNAFIVMTGLSGSGKSSLAFDTIHAEGQRRYMESMSSYARQFMELQDKPDVDSIEGLSPTIAIDQKSTSHNPRSTVGTVTEVYDHLRLLYSRAGRVHCTSCGKPVSEQTPQDIADRLLDLNKTNTVLVLAPIVREIKGEHKVALKGARDAGLFEARFDGTLAEIAELLQTRVDKTVPHTIEAVVQRVEKKSPMTLELATELVKRALDLGKGRVTLLSEDTGEEVALSQSLYCMSCGVCLPQLEPRLFSFNSPHGACPDCTGLGIKLVLEPELVIPNKRLTLAQGAVKPWTRIAGSQTAQLKRLEEVGAKHG